MRNLASYADDLRLVTRSSPRTWRGTRDKPKNVCVGGYAKLVETGNGIEIHTGVDFSDKHFKLN